MTFKDCVGGGWHDLIGDEENKQYFKDIFAFLRKERSERKIYPDNAMDIFSVFRNTSPDTVRIVVIGQDPYPEGSYDGRAFSNFPWTIHVSRSLENILKEVNDDIYDGQQLSTSPSLVRWEKQGVMLLNRVLTVVENTPDSHSNIGWEIFTSTVISKLSEYKDNIVFMLWGNNAQKIISDIKNPDNHLILLSGHPSPLSANRGYWFNNKHFSQANDYIIKHKLDYIKW
jgi:uracil-DNA glycosylase